MLTLQSSFHLTHLNTIVFDMWWWNWALSIKSEASKWEQFFLAFLYFTPTDWFAVHTSSSRGSNRTAEIPEWSLLLLKTLLISWYSSLATPPPWSSSIFQNNNWSAAAQENCSYMDGRLASSIPLGIVYEPATWFFGLHETRKPAKCPPSTRRKQEWLVYNLSSSPAGPARRRSLLCGMFMFKS